MPNNSSVDRNPKKDDAAYRRISMEALSAFLVSMLLCSLMVGFTIRNKSNLEKLTMERLILENSVKINEVVSKLLHKTQALAALVIQGDGNIEGFERVAATIVDDPAIMNILLAPGGIVSHVYPGPPGQLIGFNMMVDASAGNREAIRAYERGELVFGGPFESMQGSGMALVGRLPVWIDDTSTTKRFWGLVSVTLKYPEALNGAALSAIEKQGFAYEIWRINPDDGERQVIMASANRGNGKLRFIEKSLPILNAEWFFRVAPVLEWYEYSENWIMIISGICISILIAYVVQNNFALKAIKSDLEHHERELQDAVTIAEDASRLKTSFLATVSHEIRTPMNGIIGFLDLATDEPDVPDKVRRYLDSIKASSEGMLEIINDILDISKIEAGKAELESIPFDLGEVVVLCEAVTAPKAIMKGIRLVFSKTPEISRYCFVGDPIKLRQIFLNLLSNAIKFTEKGRVDFVVRVEDKTDDRARLYFEVHDTGIGMSEDEIDRIFDSFSQADSGTTRKYGGTGLGLAITKNLVELMGGRLEVESSPGLGTKFHFRLDFDTTTLQELKHAGATCGPEPTNRGKPVFYGDVLVCEDNTTNQEVIMEHLANVGLHPTLAVNGKEGLAAAIARKAEGRPFDLILMDVHMPVMDGVEATKKMVEAGIDTPVIAVTANIMPHDLKIYSAAGIVGCLGKPFKSSELWELLERYISPVDFAASHEDEGVAEAALDMNAETPSLDMKAGLEQALGNEQFYHSLLAEFVVNNGGVIARLNETLSAGDFKEAYIIAHSLKSASRTMGAFRLGDAASAVEDALSGDANAVGEKLIDDLETELNSVLTEIEFYAPDALLLSGEDESSGTSEFVAEAARDLLDRLAPMLEAGNSACCEMVDEIRAKLGPLGEDVSLLIRDIKNYDFDLAMETSQKIAAKIEDFE